MNHPPEYYTSRPNLLRVAREIAAMEHPERAVEALGAVLADAPEKELLAFAEAGKAVLV